MLLLKVEQLTFYMKNRDTLIEQSLQTNRQIVQLCILNLVGIYFIINHYCNCYIQVLQLYTGMNKQAQNYRAIICITYYT